MVPQAHVLKPRSPNTTVFKDAIPLGRRLDHENSDLISAFVTRIA